MDDQHCSLYLSPSVICGIPGSQLHSGCPNKKEASSAKKKEGRRFSSSAHGIMCLSDSEYKEAHLVPIHPGISISMGTWEIWHGGVLSQSRSQKLVYVVSYT